MQGEPGVDYDEPNLDPLVCDLCKQKFDSLDTLGEHQKKYHNMWKYTCLLALVTSLFVMQTLLDNPNQHDL